MSRKIDQLISKFGKLLVFLQNKTISRLQLYIMKKYFALAALGLVLLTGCTKGFDMVEPEPTPDPTPTTPTTNKATQEEIDANVVKVFGTSFSPNQDWNSSVKGSVAININSSVKKVEVMALTTLTDAEGEAYNSMRVLNQVETNNQSSVSLSYDAPKDNQGLYVAFYTANGCSYKKVEGSSVTFDQAAKTRAETDVYTYPEGEFAIGAIEDSWAAQRGWLPNEKLYMLADADYTRLQMAAAPYSQEYNDVVYNIIFSYLPNKVANLAKVRAAGYSDENAYRTTTGKSPIVVSPVYKCDKAKTYGNEVWNSDLYYYYFKQEDLNAAADPVAFLQALPKYKALPFKIHFGESEDNKLEKRNSYALLYYGEGTPEIGTKGSFNFPEGYKIGFMVRANTDFAETKPNVDSENIPRKQGELYFDGRLNEKINSDKTYNFSSSKLGTDPRATWFKINDRVLLCWESGTDSDFNDIIMEVEGGVDDPEVSVVFDNNIYTFCFEDRNLGDYDLNDVVIKAERIGVTEVKYTVVACGAYDELYLRNINGKTLNTTTEIHSLFGVNNLQTFINTQSKNYEPVSEVVTVEPSFSFTDFSKQIYIYNKTQGYDVKMAQKGEDPHAIMIPTDFAYPKEKVCVKDAYKQFNNWGTNPVSSTDWFEYPEEDKVMNAYTK